MPKIERSRATTNTLDRPIGINGLPDISGVLGPRSAVGRQVLAPVGSQCARQCSRVPSSRRATCHLLAEWTDLHLLTSPLVFGSHGVGR